MVMLALLLLVAAGLLYMTEVMVGNLAPYGETGRDLTKRFAARGDIAEGSKIIVRPRRKPSEPHGNSVNEGSTHGNSPGDETASDDASNTGGGLEITLAPSRAVLDEKGLLPALCSMVIGHALERPEFRSTPWIELTLTCQGKYGGEPKILRSHVTIDGDGQPGTADPPIPDSMP